MSMKGGGHVMSMKGGGRWACDEHEGRREVGM